MSLQSAFLIRPQTREGTYSPLVIVRDASQEGFANVWIRQYRPDLVRLPVDIASQFCQSASFRLPISAA
jgi:hypothetical protein